MTLDRRQRKEFGQDKTDDRLAALVETKSQNDLDSKKEKGYSHASH